MAVAGRAVRAQAAAGQVAGRGAAARRATRGAAVRAWHTFDPTGEGRACESLGVARGASLAEIRKAYRQMALAFHPDKVPDEAEREVHELRFREVQTAYESLQRLRKEQGRPTTAAGEAGEM